MADDGIKLLEQLNINEAHVLGTSMGGMIAQIICAQYPQKVKSFTLIASTASTPSPINAIFSDIFHYFILWLLFNFYKNQKKIIKSFSAG